MALYLHLKTHHYPYTLEEVRVALCHLSLPTHPTDQQLEKQGFVRVHSTPRPEGYEVVERPPERLGEHYYQQWSILQSHDLTQLIERTLDTNQRAYRTRLSKGFPLEGHSALAIGDETTLNHMVWETVLLNATGVSANVSLTLIDDTSLTLPCHEAVTLLHGAVAHVRHLHQRYQACQARLNDVTSVEEYHRLEPTLLFLEEDLSC